MTGFLHAVSGTGQRYDHKVISKLSAESEEYTETFSSSWEACAAASEYLLNGCSVVELWCFGEFVMKECR